MPRRFCRRPCRGVKPLPPPAAEASFSALELVAQDTERINRRRVAAQNERAKRHRRETGGNRRGHLRWRKIAFRSDEPYRAPRGVALPRRVSGERLLQRRGAGVQAGDELEVVVTCVGDER